MITREIALNEVRLDEQAAIAAHYSAVQPRSKRGWLLMALLALACLILACNAKADSVRPQLQDVASYLQNNSVLPISQQADMQLARNLLLAQSLAPYGGPLSLELSQDAVLRAISLYLFPGGPSCVCSETVMAGPWIQSRIAINPDATVSVDPSAIVFADTLVATPEPSVLVLMVLGSLVLLGTLALRRVTPCQS